MLSESTPLKGLFCIRGQYPYGPRPNQADNIFFLGELDAVWDRDRALAEWVRADYLARGYNHIITLPYGEAYSHHYPDTDYLNRAFRYVEFLKWWGHRFTLAAFPTHAPYYNGRGRWDLDAIRRDFLPLYRHPEMQRLVTRAMFCYEEFAESLDHMADCFDLFREMFPNTKRYWHNPPGHLGAGPSDADEHACAVNMVEHGIHGIYVQSHAIDEGTVDGRTAVQRMVYDLWDMQRRARGECPVPEILRGLDLSPRSPWGGPILNERGVPFEVIYAEGLAHGMYWDAAFTEANSPIWGAAARSVEGVVHCLDGA